MMAKFKFTVLIRLLILIICFNLHSAKAVQFSFTTINKDDGLLSNTVYDVTQDKLGFLWVATDMGVQRFDGSNFVLLPQVTGITEQILSSNDGYIWARTRSAFFKVDPLTLETHKFSFKDKPLALASALIYVAFIDPEANIWLSTSEGIFKLSVDVNNQLSVQVISIDVPPKKPIPLIFALNYHPQFGNIVAVNRQGVYRVDRGHHLQLIPELKLEKRINAIFVDEQKRLWLSHRNNEITEYNPTTKDYVYHQLPEGVETQKFVQDKQDNIWVASYNHGLFFYAAKTSTWINIKHNTKQHNSLASDTLMTIFSDKDKEIWVATVANGMQFYNRFSSHIVNVPAFDRGNSEEIYAISEFDACIFVGGGNHISILSNPNNPEEYSLKQLAYIQTNIVTTGILPINENTALVTSFSGLYQLNFDLTQTTNNLALKLSPLEQNLPPVLGARLYDDQALVFYFEDVHLINKNKLNTATPIKLNRSGFNSSFLPEQSTIDQFNHHLWLISSPALLMKINIQTMKLEKTYQLVSYFPELEDIRIQAVRKAKENVLWITTFGGGVIIFDLQDPENSHRLTTENSDILSNQVMSIEILDNIAWLATYEGITAIDINKLKIVKNITKQQGLISHQFSPGISVVNQHQCVIFATDKGITHFCPNSLLAPEAPENLYIQQLQLNYQQLRSYQAILPYVNQSILTSRQWQFDHSIKQLGIKPSLLDLYRQTPGKLEYRLNGFNAKWLSYDSKKVQYTALPAGEYQFEVRFKPADQRPSNHLLINWQIAPPPWQTWWAYSIYFVFGFLLLWFAYWLKSRSARRYTEKLEQQVKHRTAELEQQKDEVAQLLEDKENFFDQISHELKTPLSVINLTLLLNNQNSQDTKNRDSTAMKSSLIANLSHMRNLMDQLLVLSRIKSQTHQVTENFMVVAESKQLIAALQPLAQQQDTRLELDVNQEYQVLGPKSDFIIVIRNLLNNAIYHANAECITLSIKAKEQQLEIQVIDNGVGIDIEKQASIFDKYYSRSKSQSVRGSGLGLYIVKQIIANQQAQISLQSPWQDAQQGSRFTILWPFDFKVIELAPPNITQSQSVNRFGDKVNRNSQILVVEDETQISEAMQALLQEDFIVHCVGDGETALEFLRTTSVDLVISDINLPHMDGLSMLHQLKSNDETKNIPVIIITGNNNEVTKLQSYQLKANHYLTKPILWQELLAIIEVLLDNRDEIIEPQNIDCHDEFIQKLNVVLSKHHVDPDLDIEALADFLHISRRQFTRKVKELTGVTPLNYLKNYRLNASRELLKSGKKVGIVAEMIGYRSDYLFRNDFKEKFGETPKRYQILLKKQAEMQMN